MAYKILIDANVLIHAALTPLSTSRSMIKNLVKQGGVAYIHHYTLNECFYRIAQCEQNKQINIRSLFDTFIKQSNIIILNDKYNSEAIHAELASGYGDKIIAKAAKDYNLSICTLDHKDFEKCTHLGIHVLSPLDVLCKWIEPSLAMLAQGGLGHKQGAILYSFSFYFDVYNAGFGSLRFLLSDKIGHFKFDIANNKFILLEGLKHSKTMTLRGKIEQDKPIKFIISFNKAKIDFYASQNEWISKTSIPNILNGDISKSKLTIHGDEFKGGHIQYLHQHMRYLKEGSVNRILKGRATELPWDRINLETVIDLFYR